LHAHSAGPYKILKKVNSKVYVIDLLSDFEISSTFNISDLVAYKCPFFNPDNLLVNLDEPIHEPFFEGLHLPPLPTTLIPFAAEQIDSIQDDQIISTEMVVADDIYCVGTVVLNLMIHGLLKRTYND